MRPSVICIALAASLGPSLGAAQVLADIDTLVSGLSGEALTTAIFVAAAENTGFVDGSVKISATGAAPGTYYSSTTTDPKAMPDTPLNDIVSGTEGLGNCDISAQGDATMETCDLTLSNAQIAEVSVSSSTSTTHAPTTVTFGDITTVAAGAVNDVSLNLNLNMQGRTNGFGGADSTDTNLRATAIVMGSSASAVGMTLALNAANVDGSVSVETNAVEGGTSAINTTTVGSMNSSNNMVYMGDGGTP